MGSYLSEPLCEKISTDEDNDKLSYGASSMQGWRLSQEDAHNSILDFDTNSSFFAVYDGHGGHEVAQYCAEKLPDFFRTLDVYRSGDIGKALIDAFLGFDATITSADVIAELRQIASLKSDNEEDSDEDDENVSQLNQEAVMPLEEVMEKYTAVGSGKLAVAALKEGAGIQPVSPFFKARKSKDGAGGSGSSRIATFKKTSEDTPNSEKAGSSRDESTSSAAKNGVTGHGHVNKDAAIPETTKNAEDSVAKETAEPEKNGVEVREIKVTEPENSEDTTAEVPKVYDFKVAQECQNGELKTPENKCEANTDTEISSTVVQENGDVTKKGKGKAFAKTKGACPSVEKKSRLKRTPRQMYRKLLEYEDESADSDDEEDQTFTVMDDNSEDSEQDVSNTAIGLEEDTSDEDEEDADDEDEDVDYDDEEDEGEGDCDLFMNNMKSGPGSDSGCTAVVALLIGNELYVANAGDSRCIVCRDGKAVEMSFDHKPEDATERARVEKAGGRVTYDGRINNGLNLSRAIGDHAYKLNGDLSDREQMITALPDIKRLTVEPGRDEFMVLACDGIWNYMSSEEVVEFVRTRLRAEDRPKKLSHICEEMFDYCLAPNTMGDGTGCDNMTGIIVEFKPALAAETLAPVGNLKRGSSPTPDEPSKRPKTDLPQTESNVPATGGYDHTIKIWQTHTGICQRTLQHAESQINALEITSNLNLLAAASYQHIRMFDLASNAPSAVANYDGVPKNVTSIGFQENDKWMYSGGEDGKARIWDLRVHKMPCIQSLEVNGGAPITSVKLHPNQVEMFIGDQSGAVTRWDLKTGSFEQYIPDGSNMILDIAIDPYGNYMTAINSKGRCYIWEISPGADSEPTKLLPKNKIDAHNRQGLCCKFSPDATLLVTTSADQNAKIWNTSTFELTQDLHQENQRWVWDAAFSGDSLFVFTASSDGTAKLWNVKNGSLVREYTGHQKAITSLAFRDICV